MSQLLKLTENMTMTDLMEIITTRCLAENLDGATFSVGGKDEKTGEIFVLDFDVKFYKVDRKERMH